MAMWNLMRKSKYAASLGPQKWSAIAVLSLILFILTFTLTGKEKAIPESAVVSSNLAAFQTSVQFHPSLQFMNGTDVIWQIPESPKAALFIAHGCGVRGSKFWDKYPGCPNCTGLPEERLFVLHALERKFAVLTVSSLGRCWNFFDEIESVKWIIQSWVVTNKLQQLPIMALGASSGGYFISVLAAHVKFSSIAIMIAEGVFDGANIPKNYPPTLFVHMPKDRERMRLILLNMESMRWKGVPVKEVRCKEFPLTPELFYKRIPGLNESTSAKLYSIFREKGFIDENGYLKDDGRSTNWKQAVAGRNILPDNYGLLDHIEEELNLAYAFHEMTSLQSDEILGWFELHMS